MAGFGNILRRLAGRLREQETAPSDAGTTDQSGAPTLDSSQPSNAPRRGGQDDLPQDPTVDESQATADSPTAPPRVIENPGLSFGSELAPAPGAERPGAMVVESVGSTPVDVGQIPLADDDAIAEDPLLSNCPYCGQVNQRIGTRCQRCSQVVVRLPAWAQHRRQNWLLAKLSWRRIIFSAVVALFLVFVVWVNYPFAPNPLILLKKIQTQMTADIGPGVWTVSGRDLRNSRNVEAGFPPPKGTIVWNSYIDQPLGSEPVALYSNIYVGSANGIYPLSQHDGKIREGWEGDLPGRVTSAAAVVGSYLFFGATDHTVNAWHVLTSDVWWSFPTEDTVEVPPVVADGLVYISSGRGLLYALDAHNGSVIWQTRLDSDASAGVAIYDGRLFVGDRGGIFYILSARTGQEWFRFRTLKSTIGSPVVSSNGERVYFAAGGQSFDEDGKPVIAGLLYAVDATKREVPGLYQFRHIWAQLWVWQIPGVPRPPGQQGGLWRFAPENPLLGVSSSPALVDSEDECTLYVGAHNHNLYALRCENGSVFWKFEAEDAIWTSPVVVKDRVIFGDGEGNLYSLNRNNGEVDWKISLGSAVKIPPVFVNDLLIVRTDDGYIYGIK